MVVFWCAKSHPPSGKCILSQEPLKMCTNRTGHHRPQDAIFPFCEVIWGKRGALISYCHWQHSLCVLRTSSAISTASQSGQFWALPLTLVAPTIHQVLTQPSFEQRVPATSEVLLGQSQLILTQWTIIICCQTLVALKQARKLRSYASLKLRVTRWLISQQCSHLLA